MDDNLSQEDPISDSNNPNVNKKSAEEVSEQQLLEDISNQEGILRNAYFKLASFYSRIGKMDQAIPMVDHLMQITPDVGEKARLYLTMGQFMEQTNNFPAAIEFYQRAFTLESVDNNDWYLIHNNLGYSLNTLGRFVDGERYCRTAIQINPERYNAYKNLAISLEGQGQFVTAVENYAKAIAADGFDIRSIHHLEDLLKKQPQLLKENPELISQLEGCRKTSGYTNHRVKELLDKYK